MKLVADTMDARRTRPTARHDPGAISRLADRLVAKALVARSVSNEDRRYQALTLTAKGRGLVPNLAALADQNDAEFFGHLHAEERQRIETAMRAVVSHRGLKAVPPD